jgi:ATP-dependent helicase/nuclease subunit A
LGELERPIEHIAAKLGFPGTVECWPIEEKAPVELVSDPDAPVDQPAPSQPYIVSAERIAVTIARWLSEGERHLADQTLVTPGDILILVRKRDGLFNALIRSLNRRRLPVAGADRLHVLSEIGVKDLMALAQAVLLDRDDLSLASVLKSPLVGLSDAELEPLCRARSGSVRQEIRKRAALDPRWSALDQWLEHWRVQARHLAPFDFFSEVLASPSAADPTKTGRMAMLKRLGPDAADAIDTFLTDALAFARRHPGSLPLFLAAQSGREREIKRDLEAGNGRIRIMTVHASKGLEARIVIVAGAAAPPRGDGRNPVFQIDTSVGPLVLWAGRKEDEAELLAECRQEVSNRAWEEYRRLLYVAMTRAKDRLIVAGHRFGPSPSENKALPAPNRRNWHGMVEQAMMADAQVERIIDPAEPGRVVLRRKGLPRPALLKEAQPSDKATELDIARIHTLLRPLVRPVEQNSGLRPSPAFTIPGAALGRIRGITLHRLFERLASLPPEQRPAAGIRLLSETRFSEIERAHLLSQVLDALEQPSLKPFFAAPSRPEVPIAGQLRRADGTFETVRGRVDWLRVTDDEFYCLDLKSGDAELSFLRNEYLHQMALYRAILIDLFPDRRPRLFILWTRDMRLEELSPARLDAALAEITKQ